MTNSGGGPHCYGDDDDLNLQPNPANDGSNPEQRFDPPPPPASDPTGNEVTQDDLDARGRCYDDEGPPPPPPTRGDLAPPEYVEPSEQPELSPNDVIREIIGRCYPDVAPVTLPEVRTPDPPPSFKVDLDPGWSWMCDFFPDLANGLVCQQGPEIKLQVPDPGQPGWPHYDPDGDCERIRVGLLDGTVVLLSGDEYKDTETGEILICKEDPGQYNEGWETCVEQTLECLFRPYATGTWKPPRGDCESYTPRGWHANKDRICIKNCFPDRVGVYESTLNSGNEIGIPVMRVFMGPGNHNKSVMTTNSDGSWNGKWQKMENGAEYFQSNGQTISLSFSGFTIEGRGDTSDGDMDSEWRIVSCPNLSSLTVGQSFTGTFSSTPRKGKSLEVEIEITSGGSGLNHAYHLESSAPSGYTLTSPDPVFYILKEEARGTVPLFRFYSSSRVDTFLTTNPGQPDSPGAGERSTMDNSGMAQGEILGYVFKDKQKSLPYLGEKEEIAALHRYFMAYSGGSIDFDHRYDIDDQFGPPQIIKRYQIYPIPYNPKSSLFIFYDIHKGAAGYENCWGYYLAQRPSQGVNKAAPEPSYGKIIKADGTNSTGLGVMKIPLDKLKEFAGGYLGFFIVPDGNDENSVNDGDTVTFSETSNEGGWRCNLSSAQQNLSMFSDARLNWKDKDFTRLQGRFQWWEDLLDGDEDYDDFKVLYNLAWNGSGYLYEGIQCYVYRDPNPEKVYLPNVQRTPCDPRKFNGTFKDVTVIRTKCGALEMGDKDAGTEYECGKCTGKYTSKLNKRQTIKVIANGSFKLMAFGSITSSVMGECMRFTLRLERKPLNGSWSTIWEDTFTMKRWPEIGNVFVDNLQVTRKDKLRLTVVDIHKANFQSMNQVKLALYDNDESYFDHNFTINLGSMSTSDRYTPANATVTDDLGDGVASGGSVEGLNMDAVYGRKGNTRGDDRVYSYFSGRESEGGQGSGYGNSDSDDYVRAPIWINGAQNQIDQCSTIGPDQYGDESIESQFYGDGRILARHTNGQRWGGIFIEEPDSKIVSGNYNRDNDEFGSNAVKRVFGYGGYLVSYGDTGPHMGTNVKKYLDFPSFATSRTEALALPNRPGGANNISGSLGGQQGGFVQSRYYRLHDRGLLGWWADQPNRLRLNNADADIYDVNEDPGDDTPDEVYAALDAAGYLDGSKANPQVYTNFHPDAWFHDYYLRDEQSPLGDAKIRVMFMPIATNTGDKAQGDPYTSYRRGKRKYERQIVWVEVVEILDAGTNYAAGQSFELTYPPTRDKEIENPANSPFYPDQESNFKMKKEWRYHSEIQGNLDERSPIYDNGRTNRRGVRGKTPTRTPYEAIYQESHNKNSKVWYWCSEKAEDRIRFRVQISSTDPETTGATTKYNIQAEIDAWSAEFVNANHRPD